MMLSTMRQSSKVPRVSRIRRHRSLQSHYCESLKPDTQSVHITRLKARSSSRIGPVNENQIPSTTRRDHHSHFRSRSSKQSNTITDSRNVDEVCRQSQLRLQLNNVSTVIIPNHQTSPSYSFAPNLFKNRHDHDQVFSSKKESKKGIKSRACCGFRTRLCAILTPLAALLVAIVMAATFIAVFDKNKSSTTFITTIVTTTTFTDMFISLTGSSTSSTSSIGMVTSSTSSTTPSLTTSTDVFTSSTISPTSTTSPISTTSPTTSSTSTTSTDVFTSSITLSSSTTLSISTTSPITTSSTPSPTTVLSTSTTSSTTSTDVFTSSTTSVTSSTTSTNVSTTSADMFTTSTTSPTSSTTSTAMFTSSISSTTSSSTSSTSTTTPMTCYFSCLNQTWISSAGLLAKWTFDGIFTDEMNTYNATAVNSPSFITNGYVNQALLLTAASNQYLYTSYIPLVNASFTTELWIYPTAYPNSKDHSLLGLCTNSSGDQCLHLTVRNFAGTYRLYMSFFGDNCTSNTSVPLNQWTHAAFIFDLASLYASIYQNGVFVGGAAFALPLQGSTNNVTIGYIPGIVAAYGNNFFQGYIDQLTIVDRAKPACEILDDATFATYYNFDINPTVTDAGPNSLSSISQYVAFVSSGHRSNAISFSNTSSYFEIDDLVGLGIGNKPFSISLWIRPYSLSGTIVFVQNGTVGTLWCIPFIGFASSGSLVAQMWNGAARSLIGPILSISSVWYHIVETWSSTNGLRLYVDNTLVAADTSVTSFSTSGLPDSVILASRLNKACALGAIGSPSSFHGDIDDFRIYSREITADDVCALYHY